MRGYQKDHYFNVFTKVDLSGVLLAYTSMNVDFTPVTNVTRLRYIYTLVGHNIYYLVKMGFHV